MDDLRYFSGFDADVDAPRRDRDPADRPLVDALRRAEFALRVRVMGGLVLSVMLWLLFGYSIE